MSLSKPWLPWTGSSRAPSISDRAARCVAACLLALLALIPASAQADPRVALIIGNGTYDYVQPLDNPRNDAADMADALQSLGFTVFDGEDLTRDGILALVAEFAEAAADSDVALAYFAGHAFQVDGRNYLVPVDLNPSKRTEILEQSVSLDTIMEALERAPGLRLVFLDACRDNPLGLASTPQEGLARVGSGADFMIAYATQPGAVAFDGDGRNGTFTEALLNHIHQPGQTIGEMMIAVRKDVIAATGGQQIPWENSSLTRQFAFDQGQPGPSEETMLYQIAARTAYPGMMELYLDYYPNGSHVAEAESLLALAETSGSTVRGVQPGSLPEQDGEDLWRLAERTRIRELAAFYLELFPDGPHAEAANRLLAKLPTVSELGPGRLCDRLATHPRDATAMTVGVSMDRLRQNVSLAIDSCSAAMREFPEQPRFTALLARAKIAAGQVDEAVALYREAAARGDLRAMVSLGLLTEAGEGVPKDPAAAIALYEKAAEAGSLDGAVNFAVALHQGDVVPKDVPRAISILRRAAEDGSAIASYNLGVLEQSDPAGSGAEALRLFRAAASRGEPRGYRAAAILLDEGRGVERAPADAADLLLRGLAEDRGEILKGITDGTDRWSLPTIRAMQSRLQKAGLYSGQIDGIAGAQFYEAIRLWRAGGFNGSVLGRS